MSLQASFATAGQERFAISAVAPAMVLIEIFLPLNDNGGQPFGADKYAAIRRHLTERFGGMTAFTRSPAQGTTTEGGNTVQDDIVVFEVMTETLDASWWRGYRRELEREFRQDTIVARASAVILL
jgi:hypothetical protein